MVSYYATTMRSGIGSAKAALWEHEKLSFTRRDATLVGSCRLRKDDLTVGVPEGSTRCCRSHLTLFGRLNLELSVTGGRHHSTL